MTTGRAGLRARDHELQSRWRRRFDELPAPARDALRDALLDLRADALDRARTSWNRHKAPMALYWKVVGVYAGHLARALRPQRPAARGGRPPVHVTRLRDTEIQPLRGRPAQALFPLARADASDADPAP